MKLRLLALSLALCLLTGCAPLLERRYASAEPHSSKFWESEAAGTLRAETYQDIVNDLLLLIGQHTEGATLRLYNFGDDLAVADALESAAVEIQEQTPLGAYAVEYITSAAQPQRGYYEAKLQIGYRRTAEQLQAVVNATRAEALYSLLEAALDRGDTELAVRIGYWGPGSQDLTEQLMVQLREERELTETPMWRVSYYPPEGPVGLLEFDLDPPPEPEEESGETGEAGEDGEALPVDGEALSENGEALMAEGSEEASGDGAEAPLTEPAEGAESGA